MSTRDNTDYWHHASAASSHFTRLGDILHQLFESFRDSTNGPIQRERWQRLIDLIYNPKQHKSVGAS